MLQARSAKPRKNGQKEMAVTGKNRIMIYGPKDDGTYIIEFKTAAGEAMPSLLPQPQSRRPRWLDDYSAAFNPSCALLACSHLADTTTTVQDDRLEKHLKSVIQKN